MPNREHDSTLAVNFHFANLTPATIDPPKITTAYGHDRAVTQHKQQSD